MNADLFEDRVKVGISFWETGKPICYFGAGGFMSALFLLDAAFCNVLLRLGKLAPFLFGKGTFLFGTP